MCNSQELDGKIVWSLLEMIQVFGESYISLGKVLQYWQSLPENDLLLPEITHAQYKEALEALELHCKQVALSTSEKLVSNTLKELEETVSSKEVSQKMGELGRCIEAEIESRLFFFVPAHRAKYVALFRYGNTMEVGDELKRFIPVANKFPSIFSDLCEAGNCFATGAFTASVYHLMRICEYGLVSLAQAIGVEATTASWATVLIAIRKRLADNTSSKPEGWKEDERFYSEAANQMENVKNSWRNSVSHIRASYDEQRARIIFNCVEALMVHLASKLSECEISSGTLLADPEAKSVPVA